MIYKKKKFIDTGRIIADVMLIEAIVKTGEDSITFMMGSGKEVTGHYIDRETRDRAYDELFETL